MTNKRSTFERYKIVLIRLDLLRNWSYNFITLQLLFFLDASSNKRIVFEIMVLLIGKKPLKPSRKLRKKLSKLNKKMKKKIGDLIDKKPPKLNKKMRRKTNYSCFVHCFIGGEKLPKSS